MIESYGNRRNVFCLLPSVLVIITFCTSLNVYCIHELIVLSPAQQTTNSYDDDNPTPPQPPHEWLAKAQQRSLGYAVRHDNRLVLTLCEYVLVRWHEDSSQYRQEWHNRTLVLVRVPPPNNVAGTTVSIGGHSLPLISCRCVCAVGCLLHQWIVVRFFSLHGTADVTLVLGTHAAPHILSGDCQHLVNIEPRLLSIDFVWTAMTTI